jgi:ActD protein
MSGQIHGTVGEFTEVSAVLPAVKIARAAGQVKLEAYTPFAVEGLSAALGHRRSLVPLITLLGGLLSGMGGYGMMWYSAAVSYPLNVGGRPLHSWPAFIPITFELTILGAALACTFGMLALNGLPRLHHPIFNTPYFTARNASHGFLCILATNPGYDAAQAASLLRQAGASNVWEVAS